ncbi:MAG: endo alpha-1,4 polygalactosaminidase [Solirubrobacterales bacterium]
MTTRARRFLLLAAALLGLALPALAAPAAGAAAPARSDAFASCRDGGDGQGRWRPAPTTAPFQWQLQGRIDLTVPACVYELDGFETPKRTVTALRRRGVKVVCYVDVGSWERYRPDRNAFPRSVRGRRYDGYPDERWLDVSRFHRFAKPLKRRFGLCARKGFDAVEPDNVNGWEPENRTGFRITRADQLRFNRWVARQVHRRGMSVALKNDGRQARRLVGAFDFAVVEECFQYHECGYYRTFVRHGKAVFAVEYELAPSEFCATAEAIRFSAIRKSPDLFARPWIPCGDPAGLPAAAGT